MRPRTRPTPHPLRRSGAPPRARALFAGLLAAVAACAGDDPSADSAPAVRVDTVAGVVHVRNPAEAPAWTATEFARIGRLGVAEGDPLPDEFGAVRAVAAGGDGAIYVADAQADGVRVFDTLGALLRTIGRPGQGPGELGSPYAVGWAGDALAVLDPPNARVTLFTPEGEARAAVPWMALSGGAYSVRVLPGGWIPIRGRSVDGGGSFEMALGRLGPDGSILDTLARPTPPEDAPTSTVQCSHRGGQILGFYPVPFGASLLWSPTAGGGLAQAWGAEYAVTLTAPAGDTLRVVHRDVAPVPITDTEWEEGTREFRDRRETYGDAGECTPSGPERPAAKAIVRRLHVDHEGRLVVERNTVDGQAWDLYDARGRIRGTVPVPARDDDVPPSFRDDRVWVVSADSLGVQQVVGYRLEPAGAR